MSLFAFVIIHQGHERPEINLCLAAFIDPPLENWDHVPRENLRTTQKHTYLFYDNVNCTTKAKAPDKLRSTHIDHKKKIFHKPFARAPLFSYYQHYFQPLNPLGLAKWCKIHKGYIHRRVQAWRGIMGNQGKISRKQGSKMCVLLRVSVPSFIFVKKLLL